MIIQNILKGFQSGANGKDYENTGRCMNVVQIPGLGRFQEEGTATHANVIASGESKDREFVG